MTWASSQTRRSEGSERRFGFGTCGCLFIREETSMMLQETSRVTVQEIDYEDGGVGCFMDYVIMTTCLGNRLASVEVKVEGDDHGVTLMDRMPHSMGDLNVMQQEAVLTLLGDRDAAWGCVLEFELV